MVQATGNLKLLYFSKQKQLQQQITFKYQNIFKILLFGHARLGVCFIECIQILFLSIPTVETKLVYANTDLDINSKKTTKLIL